METFFKSTNQELRKDIRETYSGFTIPNFIDKKKRCTFKTKVMNNIINDLCEKYQDVEEGRIEVTPAISLSQIPVTMTLARTNPSSLK